MQESELNSMIPTEFDISERKSDICEPTNQVSHFNTTQTTHLLEASPSDSPTTSLPAAVPSVDVEGDNFVVRRRHECAAVGCPATSHVLRVVLEGSHEFHPNGRRRLLLLSLLVYLFLVFIVSAASYIMLAVYTHDRGRSGAGGNDDRGLRV